MMSAERRGKGIERRVPDPLCHFNQWNVLASQEIARDGHPPIGEIPHRRVAKNLLEYTSKRGAGHIAHAREFIHGPWLARVCVHCLKRSRQTRIRRAPDPCGCIRARYQSGPEPKHDEDIQQSVKHRLAAWLSLGQFSRQQRDHPVNGIVHARGNQEYGRKRIDQPRADVPSKAISPTEERRRSWIMLGVIGSVLSPEILRQHTVRPWLVRDEVVSPSSDERQIPWPEFERGVLAVKPQPCLPLNHRVNSKLNRARQPKPPRGDSDRSGKHPARGASAH